MFELIEDRGSYTSAQLDTFVLDHHGYDSGFINGQPA